MATFTGYMEFINSLPWGDRRAAPRRGCLAVPTAALRSQQPVFVLLFVLGILSLVGCGTSHAPQGSSPSPSGQILYVVDAGTITTYSVDPGSLAATPLEQPVALVPAPASLLQFDPSPDDHHVYAVWLDGQSVQHLSAFQTDSLGVPQLPAIQVLNADSLSQFNMHPGGRFAYMLKVTSSNNLYQASIRLFNAKEGSGMLTENPNLQGSYSSASYWPVFLYGFSTNGTQLYDTSTLTTGASVYRQRSINTSTGFLGHDRQLLQVNAGEEVVLGQVMVDHYVGGTARDGYLKVYPVTPNPTRSSINCTFQMLSFCSTGTDVQLDRGGHYLFITDPPTQAVHVAALHMSGHRITDTGSSLPMTSQTPGFAFSQDGSIVYAILRDDNSLHL